MQRRGDQTSNANVFQNSNGIANGDARSPNFPDGAKYEDVYWSLWWFGTFGWMKHLLRAIWTVANNFYVIPVHALYMAILSPLCYLGGDAGKQLYWSIEETFFGWLLGMVACWNYTAGYKVVESGDSLDDILDQSFLFIPNHQSTADVPLCMTIFASRYGYPDKVMWIMDRVFKFTNFGIVSWIHDDFFILAGKENRDKSLDDLKDHLQRVFVKKKRQCLVLFPEGGFLRKRKPISHRFAQKNGLPLLEYCTLPRTGALEIIMQILGPPETQNHEKSKSYLSQRQEQQQQITVTHTVTISKTNNSGILDSDSSELLGTDCNKWKSHSGDSDLTEKVVVDSRNVVSNNNQVKWNAERYFSRGESVIKYSPTLNKVVDVTIAYPNGKPLDIFDILSAWTPPCTIHVHYKIFDIEQLPRDPEELRPWMYNLYIEKEKLLEEFYRTGAFPRTGTEQVPGRRKVVGKPRELLHDPMRFLLLHLFFIASTYLFWTLGSQMHSYFFPAINQSS